ncbi:phosphatidylinositol-4-phosphate 5-kinase, putative [Eimeria tenella]|uniref:Phosphatidylinositol-4-phosphate 5-kinase, putative n=1 Tax=Eimeria tenella TaxID=5802 RepID=U6L6T6_EIMTE|nr:phosphatidylinositol-4-phosphate 5-kinase, putative [Eimeria tenella]CDJ43485.1 phosphatidylinositol-4-phosphate 5-kinase, putative [Eimeria tenella]|eukprot:XP_013234235.1 phosphatidylinositol-4-phosphate 5-kinase, putative [Eimeria tenella]
MSRFGKCCGGRAAESERLPSRVPADMADEIQRSTLLTRKEIQGLYDRFRKYAPDGRLLFSRFCDTLGVLGMLDDTMIAERMFRAFDQNKDRELSFTEFATALGVMMRGTDDQKLNLSFRILNPTYTGTGECLEDYRCHSVSTSDSEESIRASPPRQALSGPAASGGGPPYSQDERRCSVDSRRQLREAGNQLRSLAKPKGKDFLSGEKGREASALRGLTSTQSVRLPRAMRWFEIYRSVIYADSLGLDEFVDLVRCLQASRRALLGGDGILASDEEIAMTFLPLASEMPDGSRRMMLRDFKKAVHTSPRFLCLLGVACNNVSTPSCESEASVTTKSEKKNSVFSGDGTAAPCVGGNPPAPSEASSALRIELVRRVRQAEAQAERHQWKLQQQQREQLQQLAESLRAVERDVEAVKTALAAKGVPPVPVESLEMIREGGRSFPCDDGAMFGRLTSSPIRGDHERALSNRGNEVANKAAANYMLPRKTQSQGPSVILQRLDKSPETADATKEAATAAAAAAFAALQQAEQQLNRILEESTVAIYQPMHIADQLLVDMNSKEAADAMQQEPTKSGGPAFQREPTTRVRRPIFSLKTAGEQQTPEALEDTRTNSVAAQVPEAPRRQRVSFMVKCEESSSFPDTISCFQENPDMYSVRVSNTAHFPLKDFAADEVDEHKVANSSLATVSVLDSRRRPGAGTRRMYMNRAKVYQRRTTQWRRASGDTIHGGDENDLEPSKAGGKDTKGFVVHFGHESWNMVINIMVGIRLAGSRAMSEPHRAVEPYDFLMKEKFSVLPKTGMLDRQRRKPPLCAVRFIDYAPMVFRRLRAIFGIDSLLYIRSVGPEQLLGNLILGNLSSLSELVSEGKSGSLFYYTTDGRFMIKTVSKETAFFMRSVLFDYYKHVSTCSNTMLTRLCGLHAIRLKDKSGQILGGKEPWRRKTYFMVMENFFHTPVEIHRRYDLKGSTQGRSLPPELRSDPTVARKDNDMARDGEMIEIGQERKKMFIEQLTIDAAFLRDHGIMDYSLLLGISYASCSQDSNVCQNGFLLNDEEIRASQSTLMNSSSSIGGGTDFERPFWSRDLGGMQSTDRTKLYYVGIIDILTHWTAKKKLEHVARVLQ